MGELTIFLVVAVSAALTWRLRSTERKRDPVLRRRHAFSRARRVAIADAPDGEVVKVSGQCALGNQAGLSTPLTARRCVAWEVSVWGPLADRRGEIARLSSGVDFEVVDDSGAARVHGSNAWLFCANVTRFVDGEWGEHKARIAALFDTHGLWRDRHAADFDIFERVILDGAPVTVVGLARWEIVPPDAAFLGGYRDTPRRLSIVPLTDGVVVVNDEPTGSFKRPRRA